MQLRQLAVALLLVTLAAPSMAAVETRISVKDHTFVVHVTPQGATYAQVRRDAPSAVHVLPGAYFVNRDTGDFRPVDFLRSEGRTFAPHLEHRRPILAFPRSGVPFITKDADRLRDPRAIPNALAGHGWATYPNWRLARHAIVLKDGYLIDLRYRSQTAQGVVDHITQTYGAVPFLFLDGGSTLAPGARGGSWIIVRRR